MRPVEAEALKVHFQACAEGPLSEGPVDVELDAGAVERPPARAGSCKKRACPDMGNTYKSYMSGACGAPKGLTWAMPATLKVLCR